MNRFSDNIQKEVCKMLEKIKRISVHNLVNAPDYVAIETTDLLKMQNAINELIDEAIEFRHALKKCKEQNEKILSQFTNVKDAKPETPDYVNNKEPVFGEWVSVKDRLPSDANLVLAVMYNSNLRFSSIQMISYDGFGKWNAESFYNMDVWKVTHWMPLPEQPKKDD